MEKVQITSLIDLLHKNTKNITAKGSFTSHTYTLWGRILLFFMGIPLTGKNKGEVLLHIENHKNIQIWKRYFNSKLFKTYSHLVDNLFIEKQGIISFEFELKGDPYKTEYQFKKMKIAGIRMPKILSLQPYGISCLKDINSWSFDIRIYFLFTQPLLNYKGTVFLEAN